MQTIFVSKLNGDLTNLLATKYLDGYYNDIGYSLAIDSNGNIYVTGETWSSDFPITTGLMTLRMMLRHANKFSDAFVKFDSDLSASTPYNQYPLHHRIVSIAITLIATIAFTNTFSEFIKIWSDIWICV